MFKVYNLGFNGSRREVYLLTNFFGQLMQVKLHIVSFKAFILKFKAGDEVA